MTVCAGGAGRAAAWLPALPPGLGGPGSRVAEAAGLRAGGPGELARAGEPHAARVSTPATVTRRRMLMAANRSPDAPRWPGGPCGKTSSRQYRIVAQPIGL